MDIFVKGWGILIIIEFYDWLRNIRLNNTVVEIFWKSFPIGICVNRYSFSSRYISKEMTKLQATSIDVHN